MTDVLVRNLEEKTHGALKRRAVKNGRSVNAEILSVLDEVAEPEVQPSLLAILASIKSKYLQEGDDFTFEVERDKSPVRFPDFSAPEFDMPETL